MARRVGFLALVCAVLFLPEARADNPPQVVLDIRLVSVSEPFFERIGIDFEPKVINASERPKRDRTVELQSLGLTFLDDTQVFMLMEAMQGDRRSNITQFPRVTLLNDQPGTVECLTTKFFLTGFDWVTVEGQPRPVPRNEAFKMGSQIWAKPVVSADRRHVQLAFKFQQTEPANANVPLIPVQIPMPQRSSKDPEILFQMFLQQPQFNTMAIEKTVNVPSGRTVVFGGMKRTIETRVESSPAALSRIPYVNRLFRSVGYGQETETLLVLVTPRIVLDDQPPAKTAAATGNR